MRSVFRAVICAALPLALLAVGLTLGGTATGARSGKRPACATEGKTIDRTRLARVYETSHTYTGEDHGEETVVITEYRIYGCWLATGDRLRIDARCHRSDLDSTDSRKCDETWAWETLHGPYLAVAFARDSGDVDVEVPDVIVSARLGPRPLHREVYSLPKPTGNSHPAVAEMENSRRGTIAVGVKNIDVKGPVNAGAIVVIGRLGQGHKPRHRQLDFGKDVDAGSLRLHLRRHLITWKSGGHRRSAPFR